MHRNRCLARLSFLGLAVAVAGCASAEKPTGDPLPSWRDGEPAKSGIIRFVERVTNEKGPDYVPPRKRIATFDNDGTLWPEKPLYFQLVFAMDRVRRLAPTNPEWKDTQPFKAVLENDRETLDKLTMKDVVTIVNATHGGLTLEAFKKSAGDWLATARHPRYDRPYTQLVYPPMIELLDYLRANDFRVFICTGGGAEFVRAFSERVYRIPPERVIGSTSKLEFRLRNDGKPELLKLPAIEHINDKEGKPIGIARHIGRRPILAFGNSDGDLQMLQYANAGRGPRLMLLLHHDDAEREFAYDRASHVGRLDKALEEARKWGWTVVSMKRDFKRVFAFESE